MLFFVYLLNSIARPTVPKRRHPRFLNRGSRSKDGIALAIITKLSNRENVLPESHLGEPVRKIVCRFIPSAPNL